MKIDKKIIKRAWDNGFIVLFFIVFLIGFAFIMSIGQEKEKTQKKEKINAIFGKSISDKDRQKPEIQYDGQEKLYTYINESVDKEKNKTWTYNYIKKQYLPKEPEDIGGILIINDRKIIAASYGTHAGTYATAYYVEKSFTMLDPYKGITIGTKIFKSEKRPPQSLRVGETRYFYPKEKEMKKWVVETWENYLRKRD